mgnify:CR=1 FL=1
MTDDYFRGKKVALFAVPGAFTPTCNNLHIPSFLNNAAAFKAKGVDTIAVTGVNDQFVMDAWKKSSGGEGKVEFLADGNGDFAKAIGLDMDGTGFGLGVRSKRYAMLVEDGVVKRLSVEPETGKEIWRVKHGGMNASAIPQASSGLVFLGSGDGGWALGAVKLGRSGKLDDSAVALSSASLAVPYSIVPVLAAAGAGAGSWLGSALAASSLGLSAVSFSSTLAALSPCRRSSACSCTGTTPCRSHRASEPGCCCSARTACCRLRARSRRRSWFPSDGRYDCAQTSRVLPLARDSIGAEWKTLR